MISIEKSIKVNSQSLLGNIDSPINPENNISLQQKSVAIPFATIKGWMTLLVDANQGTMYAL